MVLRGGSSPKILEIYISITLAPISTFITESIFSVLRNRKKYKLHIGLHLKSITSGVANSVICNSETRRNKARRAESGVGFLTGGRDLLPIS